MKERHFDWAGMIVTIAYLGCGGVAVFAASLDRPEVFFVLGLVAGPASIWLLLRQINRHDSSRRAKPPPDPS